MLSFRSLSLTLHTHTAPPPTIMKNYQTLTALCDDDNGKVVDKIFAIKQEWNNANNRNTRESFHLKVFSSRYVRVFFSLLSISPSLHQPLILTLFTLWCQISRTLSQRAFHKTPFRQVFLYDPHFPSMDGNKMEKSKHTHTHSGGSGSSQYNFSEFQTKTEWHDCVA